MGGAIKAVSNVMKTATSVINGLAGGALKNVIGGVFNSARNLAKALSPIAPNFFAKLDAKIERFQPKVMNAIDKGVDFVNRFNHKAQDVLANVGKVYMENFVPMGRQLAQIDF